MSEMKNTALATTASGYLALADNHLLEEAMAEECAGLEFTLDRVKLPAGGGTAFELPSEDGEDTEMAKDITGVILTKLDGDARGGAALSVRAVTGKPIKFVGQGEKLDQIEPFHPERMASRILGMGDVLTLIEKAEAAMDEKKAMELEKKLRSSKFTLADYYDQLLQLKSMGSMQDMLAMMPGMGSMKNVQLDEKALVRTEAIIQSMTPAERDNPACLNHNRKRRIAAGSGTKVEDVNKLLKQFEMMQNLMRQMTGPGASKKMKKKARQFGGMPGMGGLGGMPGGFRF